MERRARELDRREEELRNAPPNLRQNNWPPLPKFCPVQPCFYQDINVDIPVEFQKMVGNLYYCWVFQASLYLANVIVALLCVCTLTSNEYGILPFVMGLIYLALNPALSFIGWFRSGYKAFRDDSSFNFMIFFFTMLISLIISTLFALGIPAISLGSYGLIIGFQTVSLTGGGKIFCGVLLILLGFAWGIASLGKLYLLVQVIEIIWCSFKLGHF